MKRRQCLGIAIALVSIAIFVSWLNWRALLAAVGCGLDVGKTPRAADAVVLLNGGENTRPFIAAALVTGGWAPKVILNTVRLHQIQESGAVPPSHEIAVRVMEYAGLSRDQVEQLSTSAQTTFDEARGVATYLDTHPMKRLILVTEAPHTRRAEWIFHHVLSNRNVGIMVVSAPPDGFNLSTWWQREDGLLFVLSEYLKLFFYTFRYGWLGYEIVLILAALFVLQTWFRWRRKPVSDAIML